MYTLLPQTENEFQNIFKKEKWVKVAFLSGFCGHIRFQMTDIEKLVTMKSAPKNGQKMDMFGFAFLSRRKRRRYICYGQG